MGLILPFVIICGAPSVGWARARRGVHLIVIVQKAALVRWLGGGEQGRINESRRKVVHLIVIIFTHREWGLCPLGTKIKSKRCNRWGPPPQKKLPWLWMYLFVCLLILQCIDMSEGGKRETSLIQRFCPEWRVGAIVILHSWYTASFIKPYRNPVYKYTGSRIGFYEIGDTFSTSKYVMEKSIKRLSSPKKEYLPLFIYLSLLIFRSILL